MHRYTRWLIGAGAILAVIVTVVLTAALATRDAGDPAVRPPPGHATTPSVPTPPVDESGPEVRITAAGDIGSSAEAVAVLRLIDSLAPDANVAMGDLSYGAPGTESDWCDLVRSIVGPALPFQLLAGNHESDSLNGDIRKLRCLPPSATTWGVVDLHVTRETLDLRFVLAEGGSFRDQITIRAPSGSPVNAPTAT